MLEGCGRGLIYFQEDAAARARLHPMFLSVRGAIGDTVFRQYGDRLVISRKPVFRDRVFSKAQKECQERFRQAARFAKQLMQDPRARAVYEAEARMKGKPVHSLIISDYFQALRSPTLPGREQSLISKPNSALQTHGAIARCNSTVPGRVHAALQMHHAITRRSSTVPGRVHRQTQPRSKHAFWDPPPTMRGPTVSGREQSFVSKPNPACKGARLAALSTRLIMNHEDI